MGVGQQGQLELRMCASGTGVRNTSKPSSPGDKSLIPVTLNQFLDSTWSLGFPGGTRKISLFLILKELIQYSDLKNTI